MKGNGKDAPILAHVGNKWNNRGTYDENTRPNGYYFGQCPNIIRRYIMNELDGNNGNLLKVMWLLIDTKEGWGLSKEWVSRELGMAPEKYYTIRKKLINMNWLIYEMKDNKPYLAINYEYLWAQAILKYGDSER